MAVGYAVLQAVGVISDARLQERAPAALRATVTSVRGLGAASTSMVMFVVIGAMASGDDPTPGLFVLLAALAGAGFLAATGWLPAPAPTPEPVD